MSFRKALTQDDAQLFRQLLGSITGQPCTAWRKSYGRAGHLHFGPLGPRPQRPTKMVYADEGRWILHLWEGVRAIQLPDCGLLDSVRDGEDAVTRRMHALVGMTLSAVSLESCKGKLALSFTNGACLTIEPEEGATPDNEIWNFILPSREEIVLYGGGEWGTQEPDAGT